VSNTEPNSALLLEDGSFAPAHMLPDARLERAGRQSKLQRRSSFLGRAGGERPTAGLLIIGDEILSAKVADANSPFLCRELRALGWTVSKVGCCRRLAVGGHRRAGRLSTEAAPGRLALLQSIGTCIDTACACVLMLFDYGYQYAPLQVVMVRDDVAAICQEVKALSEAHDIVITAGGLGERIECC
jgi:hypothetical protein